MSGRQRRTLTERREENKYDEEGKSDANETIRRRFSNLRVQKYPAMSAMYALVSGWMGEPGRKEVTSAKTKR